MDSVEEGEGGMIWDNGIETCIISYVKRKQKKERGGTNVKEDLPKQKMCWEKKCIEYNLHKYNDLVYIF